MKPQSYSKGETTARRGRLEEFLICACVVLFLSSLVLPASILECFGQAGSATVAVSPPSITASVGQDFIVDINISNVSDLYGWEFYFGWNSSLLSLVSVNEGPFLKSGGNTFFTYFLNTTDEHVVVDCTLEGQIPGVSGNGTLATVTLNTTNVGECPLNLYNVDLRDSSDASIASQAVGGNFTSMLHDVAVTSVTASPTAVLPGTIVTVNVTVQNGGSFAEVFNLTAYANSQAIGTQQVSLNSGDSGNLSFTWNTTGYGKGDYNISASVGLALGEVNAGNNTGMANTPVTILVPGHDVAVVSVEPLKTAVGQGYNMSIKVTVKNYGVFSETFNVTAYANTTLVGTQTVNLASGTKADILLVKSTVSMIMGNYNVSATAGPVPGETNMSDNSGAGGWVIVTIPGDLNADGVVNILDAVVLSDAFNSVPGTSSWNANADINGDNVVNILDAIILANHFGYTAVY
jgi:hypothetical protein